MVLIFFDKFFNSAQLGFTDAGNQMDNRNMVARSIERHFGRIQVGRGNTERL